MAREIREIGKDRGTAKSQTRTHAPSRKLRLTLIYPDRRRYTGNFSTHRMPGVGTAHLGLQLLGEICRQQGHEVHIYDEQITPFATWMVDRADVVGISTQTSWSPQAYRIADRIRKMGKPLMMGGAHATLNPDECLDHADYVCRNEGEKTLPELLEVITGHRSPDTVLGISYWKDGRKIHNSERPFLTNAELSALPDPNWKLIEGWYNPVLHPLQNTIYPVQATRGCPAYCNFCSITEEFGRTLRYRSAKSVLAELHRNFDPDRQFLFFVDDSLAGNRDYMRELLEGLLEQKMVPRMGWHSQMRADVASDPALVKLMRKTNCLFATFGFESINPHTLKSLQKGQTPESIRRCIAQMQEEKILVNGFFMLGSDYDTKESIQATWEFASKSGCIIAGFMPLTPFPGTGLFKEMDSEGRIFIKDWELYDVQHVVYWPKNMTPSELYLGCLKAYREFYRHWLRPELAKHTRAETLTLSNALIGGTWPLMKISAYYKEIFANRDYIRMLKRIEKERDSGKNVALQAPFNTNSRFQDFLTNRREKALLAEGLHLMGAIA